MIFSWKWPERFISQIWAWNKFWGAFHICRSKIGDIENLFHICHIFESPQPGGCSWRGYATQETDQELKWKLRTLSVWEIWVLDFLRPQSLDTKGGLQYLEIGLRLSYHRDLKSWRQKMKKVCPHSRVGTIDQACLKVWKSGGASSTGWG